MDGYIKREDETGYIKKADAIRLAVRESTECVIGDDYTEADSARVGEAVARVIYALQTMLPADVAPVRHGRWIETSYDEYQCSVCGKAVRDEIIYAIKPDDKEGYVANYCPNCGAKMDR